MRFPNPSPTSERDESSPSHIGLHALGDRCCVKENGGTEAMRTRDEREAIAKRVMPVWDSERLVDASRGPEMYVVPSPGEYARNPN